MKTLDTSLFPVKRYGVTERKKAELDAIAVMVLDAQYDVEQLQAIVTSLTEKSNKFQGALADAIADRAHTLDNRNLLDVVVQNALSLLENSEKAFSETVIADVSTKNTATAVKSLIDKLIYSAEVINKLSTMVIRKKALNPLISDDLVSRITVAGNDANNAVALTLVALQAAFTTQASSMESEAAASLEYIQSMQLYETLTGTNYQLEETRNVDTCLKTLLYQAYDQAESAYKHAHRANADTLVQLNEASVNLIQAQIKLKSLQAGFAAGNAAALAS
ncbi:hypothetical protein [Mucilaginibacter sp. L196]|uniref:hypothetical protein n=1 Tax=Mucilaginibacter sp. L196 TaxID=1641870 RepID=UPI00131DAC03|nr:hypothetical protein [Mucilaginibacter sp. L196]